MPTTDLRRRGIPDATVARLPLYLRALGALTEAGSRSTSSEALAAATGVPAAKVRKDLSYLGSYGVRGVGYDVASLAMHIARELGLAQEWPVVIVGMGNLGRALAGHAGLSSGGFNVVGLFDRDPEVIGTTVAGIAVAPMRALAACAEREEVIGVIATPVAAAQEVADALVAAGITSILDFAGAALSTPEEVDVRRVDVTTELRILALRRQRRPEKTLEQVAP